MGWRDFLVDELFVLPWIGGRQVHGYDRSWTIHGKLPPEHGWYDFLVHGRKVTVGEPTTVPNDYTNYVDIVKGYIVGDRLIPDTAKVEPDPAKIIQQTYAVHLVERGLDLFARAVVAINYDGEFIYIRQEFPIGAESAVTEAYENRVNSLDHIKGVWPALDYAFKFVSWQRQQI